MTGDKKRWRERKIIGRVKPPTRTRKKRKRRIRGYWPGLFFLA
jgi:hypothetical protein